MMKVFIYWNRIDQDSKKIYKFLGSDSFRHILEESNEVVFFEPYLSFSLTQERLNQISHSDIIIFFTHGEEDAILKSKYIQINRKKSFSFIDFDNASLLSGKKVIAICCASAKSLGQYCVTDQINSTFYVGFQDDIFYDDGSHEDVRGLVYDAYSDAFEKSILYSLSSKCTAQEFVQFLQKKINDMITYKILNETNDHTLGSLSSITFHRKSAQSLVALGKIASPIFS